MSKIIEDASIQFGKQLDRYIKHFELDRTDIGSLLGTTIRSVDKIIAGDKGLVLKSIEKIAGFFGTAYFEFGNPNFPIPEIDDLPESTRAIILNRQSNQKKLRDLGFTRYLEAIVDSGYLKLPRTAKEIFAKMPKEITGNKKYKATRVTDAFKNGKLKKRVVSVGYRGAELEFQVIEFVGKKS